MSKLVQPLKWHGGKHYMAKRIIEIIPPHIHYVEPYFGGGSVFLQKPVELIEGHSEVVNDINGQLTNFWKVLSNSEEFESLSRLLEATPFSKELFDEYTGDEAEDLQKIDFGPTRVARALWFFVKYRQSRQGLGKDFATLSRNRTRRGMNEQVSSWLTAIDGLPEVHERLKRVVILNDEALKVIRQQDGRNTFFYLDPPYLHETRSSTKEYGKHEMSREQHAKLLNQLCLVKGKFILSGYRSDMYDHSAKLAGWHRVDIEIDNKASSKKKKDKKTECLWMNYEVA